MMYTCGNCGRANISLSTVTIEQYSANLCCICAYIIEKQPARFNQLVRKQNKCQANEEMKKQHAMLSSLIACGIICLIVIGGVGVAQQMSVFATQSEQVLTFLHLKQL